LGIYAIEQKSLQVNMCSICFNVETWHTQHSSRKSSRAKNHFQLERL